MPATDIDLFRTGNKAEVCPSPSVGDERRDGPACCRVPTDSASHDASQFYRLEIGRNKSSPSKHLVDCIDQVGSHPHFGYVRVASRR